MKLFVALALVAFVGCSLVKGRSLVARDAKSTLIAKGNDLVKKAEEAITKLEADKKTHEATIVKTEEAKIKKLIADLEAATEASAITRLEHELSRAEHQLQFELEKINHAVPHLPIHIDPIHQVPTKRAAKDALITRGNDLLKKADEAIVKLEADKKTHEVTVIKSEEAKIKKLIADLEAATDDAKVKTLEHELVLAENRLAHELQRINHVPAVPHVPTKRDAKSELITKGNDLLKKADAALAALKAGTHLHEVAIVKHEEEQIKKLIADLEAATDEAKIKTLEHELTRAEARLSHELTLIQRTVPTLPHTPINPVPAKRDTKSELTTKGNDLIKKADEAIKKLEADKKIHEVAILKREEALIKKLITDLEAATDATAITHIEHELTRAEARLTHELDAIAKGTHPTPHIPETPIPAKRAAKDALITKGNDLIKKADEAIVKLEADKKTHEVTIIKTEEAKIKKLIADLEAATDDAKVKALEHELVVAENRLNHELQRVNHVPVPPTF